MGQVREGLPNTPEFRAAYEAERQEALDEVVAKIRGRPERMRRLLEQPRAWQCPRCGEPAPVLERHCTEEEDPYCCWLVFSCPACGEVVDEDPGDG